MANEPRTGRPAALAFLRRLREDSGLAQKLRGLEPIDALEPVIALAASTGYRFSAEDLRTAHRLDWQLRRAAYASASAESTVAVVNTASPSR
jgi:predicted ribosomally synthesized peptide with nif11-like leader